MERTSEWVTAAPAPVLTPFIERYIGYRMRGFAPGLHRGLPSRNMTFIVDIGPGIDVVTHPDTAATRASYGCVIGGLQASPALIAHDGNQEGVEIELTPLGSRAVLGLPAGALWNASLELGDVIGRVGEELWERLQGPAPWADRFSTCDDLLSGIVEPGAGVTPELGYAWRTLARSHGTTTVREVAADVGWSRQHLTRRFGDEFGLGPKLAARVMRFERARQMIQSTPPFLTLAQVAATCGYYDQAHLDRDFAELAGCSPTAWIAEEELPLFQAEEATAG